MNNINTISLSGYPGSDQGMHHETNCGDRIKLIWWDGTGLCLMAKKLEQGGFKWPGIRDGVMRLTAAQLGASRGPRLAPGPWRAPDEGAEDRRLTRP